MDLLENLVSTTSWRKDNRIFSTSGERMNGFIKDIGFSQQTGKEDYIPEKYIEEFNFGNEFLNLVSHISVRIILIVVISRNTAI